MKEQNNINFATKSVDFSGYQTGVNNRQQTAFMLQAPISGDNGWLVALREPIVNSADARATDIRIIFLPNGDLLIADNGTGMDAMAMASALSFGHSAKDRKDLKTAGANGTGQNIALGLGDLNRTEIEVVTSCDGKNFVRFTKDYEYFCLLNEGKVTPESRVRFITVPNDWTKYLARTSGTNVVLKNCKLPGSVTLVQNFAKALVPSVAEIVQVHDGQMLRKLVPDLHDGEYFVVSEDMKQFGRVDFELFIGAAKRSRIEVCGPTNAVVSLSELLEKRYDAKDKPQILSAFSSCSGWIYLSNMNEWRLHDGTLSPDFFDKGASRLLMQSLIKVATQVAEKVQTIKQDEAAEEYAGILSEFVTANNLEFFNTKSGKQAGILRVSSSPRKEFEVQINPSTLYMQPSQSMTFTFENTGTLRLKPEKWIADDAGSPAKVKGSYVGGKFVKGTRLGNVLELESASQQGTGYIILKHPDLHGSRTHSVKVIVSTKSDPVITGPAMIQSGREVVYKLLHFDNDAAISWSIKERGDTDVAIRSSGKRLAVLSTKVLQRKKTVTLLIFDQKFGKKIAEKEVDVFPPVQSGDFCITVCDQQFQLQPTPIKVNGPLAHMGPDWGELPVIALNFNSPIFLIMPSKKQQLLNSIVTVAMAWLVSKGKIDPLEMPFLQTEFLERMNRRMKM